MIHTTQVNAGCLSPTLLIGYRSCDLYNHRNSDMAMAATGQDQSTKWIKMGPSIRMLPWLVAEKDSLLKLFSGCMVNPSPKTQQKSSGNCGCNPASRCSAGFPPTAWRLGVPVVQNHLQAATSMAFLHLLTTPQMASSAGRLPS